MDSIRLNLLLCLLLSHVHVSWIKIPPKQGSGSEKLNKHKVQAARILSGPLAFKDTICGPGTFHWLPAKYSEATLAVDKFYQDSSSHSSPSSVLLQLDQSSKSGSCKLIRCEKTATIWACNDVRCIHGDGMKYNLTVNHSLE
jgi:hypothetical protein